MSEPRLRILSLGAGVQSTALALMAAAGEFPERIDAAIFADTGWEPKAVYAHLNWLEPLLPFPVYRVSIGDIRAAILTRRNTSGGTYAAIPWFTVNPDGSHGMGRRQCTSEYKLRPIMHKLRDLLGVTRTGYIAPKTIEMLVGISTDEATRMKPAQQRYIHTRWPLIERGMSRLACYAWLSRHGHPEPPKSACVGCPFHNQAMWQEMERNAPEEFADACAVDEALRSGEGRSFKAVEFMHSARIPLREAVALKSAPQINLFENECEGMCGV